MGKKFSLLFSLLLLLPALLGCRQQTPVQVVATTRPVYEFTTAITRDTPLSVGLLVTEQVSCLHDYTLQVSQMQLLEGCQVCVINGAGLEGFLEDALQGQTLIDASGQAHIHSTGHQHHDHDHDHDHSIDAHIWLSPENAMAMATTICQQLSRLYPQHQARFRENCDALLQQLEQLQAYGEATLSQLSCRQLITFHDGFGYLAESFDLQILRAVEEEAGSEASAGKLKELVELVRSHRLPAIFIERSGSSSAAGILSAETAVPVYTLDMAMAGDYFEAMYHNIDTLKEALQ